MTPYSYDPLFILAGCGSDSEIEAVKQESDRIEKVGNGASTLGYDGEAIKKQLRDMQGASQDRNKELDDVMGN